MMYSFYNIFALVCLSAADRFVQFSC